SPQHRQPQRGQRTTAAGADLRPPARCRRATACRSPRPAGRAPKEEDGIPGGTRPADRRAVVLSRVGLLAYQAERSSAVHLKRPPGGPRYLKLPHTPADQSCVDPADDLVARELMLNRFRRLLAEVQRGHINRNAFEVWEVEILLDLEACALE